MCPWGSVGLYPLLPELPQPSKAPGVTPGVELTSESCNGQATPEQSQTDGLEGAAVLSQDTCPEIPGPTGGCPKLILAMHLCWQHLMPSSDFEPTLVSHKVCPMLSIPSSQRCNERC